MTAMSAHDAYNRALEAIMLRLSAAVDRANTTPPQSPRFVSDVLRARGIADAWDAVYHLAQEEDAS